jgi:Uma2 family endonuclease
MESTTLRSATEALEVLGRVIEQLERGAPTERMDYEEFLVRYDGQHAEWIDGEVQLRMSGSTEHQDLQGFLLALLRHWVESGDFGVVQGAPFQMKLEPQSRGREPDVLFVATSNLGRLRPTFLDGPADLAIEIVSPESVGRDRGEKYYEYQSGGVREYWIINPERRHVEWCRLQEDGAYKSISTGEDGVYRSPLLPGLWLREEWLWQRPLPKLLTVLREWQLI